MCRSPIDPLSSRRRCRRLLLLLHLPATISSSTDRDLPRSVFQKVTNLDDALNLFDEMKQRRPLPSVIKFTQLLDAVSKMEHCSCSVDLFKQMCALVVPVDVYPMTIGIKCCCQLYCTNEGFAVLGSCFKRGILPDVCTFNTLLNRLILDDRILEAERLFKMLIKKKLCKPNVVTYSTMIKGLCKMGNNDTDIALLRLMDERGCKPDGRECLPTRHVTYNVLLQGYMKNRQYDDVEMFLEEMGGRGYSLDASSSSLLLDQIAARSLDTTLLKLIGKLVPRESIGAPCFPA